MSEALPGLGSLRPAFEDVDPSGPLSLLARFLKRRANGQVVLSVAVEIACGQGKAEPVVLLVAADALLSEGLPGLGSLRRSFENEDPAGLGLRARFLIGRANGQVVLSVAVEVARGQGKAELVTNLVATEAFLREYFPRRETEFRPSVDKYGTGIGNNPHIFFWCANGQVS